MTHDPPRRIIWPDSEFLSTGNQIAVFRDSLGKLKEFVEMATYVQTADIGHFARADEREVLTREALTREVRRGLIASPRSLSPWMFYDAAGSRLFERITTLPEYYPTRTERAILAEYADAIVAAAHGDGSLPLRLVELGAGTASKTCILLEAALRVSDDVAYLPVDVCPDALELACQNVARALPEVRMHPITRADVECDCGSVERFELERVGYIIPDDVVICSQKSRFVFHHVCTHR